MRKILTLTMMALLLAVLPCCAAGPIAHGDAVKEPVSDTQLSPKMQVDRLTVIDLNASWCGPCRIFAPAFDKAAQKFTGKVDFYSVDTDQYGQTAMAFAVRAIPTIVFITPKGEVKTYVGLNDFFDGLDMNSNPSQAEVEQAIYNNLCAKIDALLK